MAEVRKVVVTGGSGKAGKWVIAEFLEHGYEVINVDLRPSDQVPTYFVDLCDLGQVFWAVEGCHGIVHLAATNWPGDHAPEVVFRNNVMSSFNLMQAATVLGIRKVVLAGSESALGFPFRFQPISPRYLPMDEVHPLLAQDAYGLSKIAIEELGRGFARRSPDMAIVSLRLSYIVPPELYAHELRAAWQDPEHGAYNLWAYVDARDMARAFRLALEQSAPGFDAFYIAAADTLMRQPTLDLVRQFYPDAGEAVQGFGERQSPLDCRRARAVLGFEPEYSWDRVVPPEAVG